MASTRLLALEPYDEANESFVHYLERFDIYVEANAIAKARRKAVFLNLLGARLYNRLRSLMTPVKPNDLAVTLDELKNTLKEHLSPAPLEIAEVYRFHCRRQQPGESMRDFYAQLRALAEHCNFGDFRDKAIRNQLVCGMLCETTRRRLLCEKDLTLVSCINIATAAEASAKAAEAMSQIPPSFAEVNKVVRARRDRKPSKSESPRAHQVSDTKVLQDRQLRNFDCSTLERTHGVRLLDDRSGEEAAAAEGPWQRVFVDFAGPIDNVNFLLASDAYSRWPEVVVMPKTTVSATVAALRTIFARQGLPRVVVTDCGPQFRSREFHSFLQRNCIKHCRTAQYDRRSNDAAECFVQTFKQAYRASAGPAQLRVDQFLLKYRSTVLDNTSRVPSELLMGRRLRTLKDALCFQSSLTTQPASLRDEYTSTGAANQQEENLRNVGRNALRSVVR